MIYHLKMLIGLCIGCVVAPVLAQTCNQGGIYDWMAKAPDTYRFATFNAFLNRREAMALVADLREPDDQPTAADRQIKAVAEIIQRVRPDVLLLNEFDFDEAGVARALLQQNYLQVSQGGQPPITYPYAYDNVSNTGIDSGFDLDNDGAKGGAADALGYGEFPGQYGMLLLSRFPIDEERVRTFRRFLWKNMPQAKLPTDFFTAAELAVLPLSSKSHWDIPIEIDGQLIHVLAAHPTPPVFDGPEDRNGRRNHDEIRLWADYVAPARQANYIVDDDGTRGGLGQARFVIMGDYNADPADGDSSDNAIDQLLQHPAINADVVPTSEGAVDDARAEAQANIIHQGEPASDTADFNPQSVGNLRLDYVLPSQFGLQAVCAGVFWPKPASEGYALVGSGYPIVSSDHRLVWVDVKLEVRNR